VTIADRSPEQLATVERDLTARFPKAQVASKVCDATNAASVREALKGHDYVICMLPFNFVEGIAAAANELGVHYFDVTEDVETTNKVRDIASKGQAKVALVPQCGLAPGYIAIAANRPTR
jgi:saccharopine dehydrogenase-like NADP-dependent oxidoreductase